MKLKKVSPIIAMLLVVLVTGCSKDLGSNGSNGMLGTSDGQKSVELPSTSGSLAGVNLGVAGDFAILSKTGVTDVYKSAITGDVGSSPITGAAILVKCNSGWYYIYS